MQLFSPCETAARKAIFECQNDPLKVNALKPFSLINRLKIRATCSLTYLLYSKDLQRGESGVPCLSLPPSLHTLPAPRLFSFLPLCGQLVPSASQWQPSLESGDVAMERQAEQWEALPLG